MSDNAKQRVIYYTKLRDHVQKLVDSTETKMQAIEASTKAFSKEFARIRKGHQSLLEKANKKIASELKKASDAGRT